MVDRESDSPVVGSDDAGWIEAAAGDRHKRLAVANGGHQLGCTIEELVPAGDPTPYHYHMGNEEALYVLQGKGLLRTPHGKFEIESGDYVAFPTGRVLTG